MSPPPGGRGGRRAESHACHGTVTVVVMIVLLLGTILTLLQFVLAGNRQVVTCELIIQL